MTVETIGKIYPARSMFFRHDVGKAEAKGTEYEMSANMGDMAPIIHSKQSGKWFVLSWQDIIDLARSAGIDEKE